MRPLLLPATIAVALLLTGCGASAGGTVDGAAPAASDAGSGASGSSDAAADPGGGLSAASVMKDACAVLSADEAAAATGTPITKADGVSAACEYTGDDHGIFVTYSGSGDTAWEAFVPADGTTVSGLGDRAVSTDGDVVLQKGTIVVDVSVAGSEAADTPTALALAKAIAAKL